jgi:F0F1-type ATP synthase membrane subunit b/b'
MPQLDQINYFSQVFWLVISFITLYTFFLKDYIPFMFKLKKLRHEKVSNHFDYISFFDYINAEVLYRR